MLICAGEHVLKSGQNISSNRNTWNLYDCVCRVFVCTKAYKKCVSLVGFPFFCIGYFLICIFPASQQHNKYQILSPKVLMAKNPLYAVNLGTCLKSNNKQLEFKLIKNWNPANNLTKMVFCNYFGPKDIQA